MKLALILFIFLLLNNCSLNKDSKYWTEEGVKKIEDQKKLSKVVKKSTDITTMTHEQYKIYIENLHASVYYRTISEMWFLLTDQAF